MNAPSNLGSLPLLRSDLARIVDMVEPGSRVLDIGCGDGALLEVLKRTKRADARGIELSQAGVNACVARGLSVIQGDADRDLSGYSSDVFDYVILSQTIQATHNPKAVLHEIVRIGKRAIVSFPNFGFWKVRLKLLLGGRMPMTSLLTHAWHNTPNIHLCTVHDFVMLTDELGIRIQQAIAIHESGRAIPFTAPDLLENLLAAEAIFLLSR
jgi:methionine biosynthesis protein MetW